MYVLTVSDYLSKFCLFFPMQAPNAKTISQLIEDYVILFFGVRRGIVCDNGKQFTSNEFKNFAAGYKVKLVHTLNYHPQANAAERLHGVIKTMCAAYVKDNHRT